MLGGEPFKAILTQACQGPSRPVEVGRHFGALPPAQVGWALPEVAAVGAWPAEVGQCKSKMACFRVFS